MGAVRSSSLRHPKVWARLPLPRERRDLSPSPFLLQDPESLAPSLRTSSPLPPAGIPAPGERSRWAPDGAGSPRGAADGADAPRPRVDSPGASPWPPGKGARGRRRGRGSLGGGAGRGRSGVWLGSGEPSRGREGAGGGDWGRRGRHRLGGHSAAPGGCGRHCGAAGRSFAFLLLGDGSHLQPGPPRYRDILVPVRPLILLCHPTT